MPEDIESITINKNDTLVDRDDRADDDFETPPF